MLNPKISWSLIRIWHPVIYQSAMKKQTDGTADTIIMYNNGLMWRFQVVYKLRLQDQVNTISQSSKTAVGCTQILQRPEQLPAEDRRYSQNNQTN